MCKLIAEEVMGKSRLQQELKKRDPFDNPHEEALLNIAKTQDYIFSNFGKFFREFEITGAQYNVLRILRGEGQPLPSLEIASRLVHSVPGITGLIDRLEKAELVLRERSPTDRRVVFVQITKKGLKLIERIDPVLTSTQKSIFGHMTKKELATLSRLLEKVRGPEDP